MALKAINDRVDEKDLNEEYFKEIQELRDKHNQEKEEDAQNKGYPINPGYVIQAIKCQSDDDAVIAVDSGDHTYWFYKKYTCTGEKTLMSAAMASMGFAFPVVLASKIAYPERQTIAVNGDEGFGMLMADFTTAVRDNLDVKVVVFNDKRLKNIKRSRQCITILSLVSDSITQTLQSSRRPVEVKVTGLLRLKSWMMCWRKR